MVKKEVFELIINKQRIIELKRAVTVFQCGRNILRRKINKKEGQFDSHSQMYKFQHLQGNSILHKSYISANITYYYTN